MVTLSSPNGSLLFLGAEMVVVGRGLLIHIVCKMLNILAILALKNCLSVCIFFFSYAIISFMGNAGIGL